MKRETYLIRFEVALEIESSSAELAIKEAKDKLAEIEFSDQPILIVCTKLEN